MKKKFLSLALALTMCLGLLVVPASAAGATVVKTLESEYEESFHYRIYSDGMLVVEKRGSPFGCVYLDRNGNEIPGALFDAATEFSEGMAAVNVMKANWGDKYQGYGYIDKTGKVVIEPQFEDAGQFHEGVARVRDLETRKWGIIDKNGNGVVPLEYSSKDYIHEPSDGLILAYDAPNGYWGYFDTNGKTALPFQYAYGYDFEAGYAQVKLGQKSTYIDKSGRDIIADHYEYAKRLTVEGEPAALFSVKDTTATDRNCYYLLNGSGQVLAGPYEDIGEGFSSGLMRVRKYDGENYLHGYINTAGQEVIPCGRFRPTYSSNMSDFVDGYALVGTQDYTQVMINTSGQITATLSQDLKYNREKWSQGLLAVSSDASGRTRWGFLHASGQQTVECKYQSVRAFSGGVAVVQDFAGKYGLVNTAGQEIVPCQYSSISEFINGVAAVSMYNSGSRRYGLINAAGQEILPCVYEEGYSFKSGSVEALMDTLRKGGEEVCAILRNEETNRFDFIRITTDYSPAPDQPVTPPASGTVGGFSDVKTDDWFANPVLWAVEKGITAGTSATTFSPNADCTTAQILSFLWRASGSPKPTGSNPFSDVESGDWYADAAVWAYEKGMVSGGTFSGNTLCTRSMAVTYMWKAAGSPSAKASSFTDVPAGAEYAGAVAWAVEQGVTAGTSDTTFSPDSVCTRGQIVAFLHRGLAK
ncbi:MAG: hypothetical protein HFF52_08400 [Lawsonibacter sp.]|nr:hypothetical protein [Lawsonibacter sp.]